MGSQKQPDVVHPGEAAQAAMGTAAAGEMMSVANQPIEQYAQLQTNEELGPAQMQTQQSLANRAAYQGALAQRDIQSRVDPQAYAQREMRMQAANKKLGRLYGVDPQSFNFSAPQAYAIPGTADQPDLGQIVANAQAVASRLSTGSVNKSGADPRLNKPQKPKDIPYAQASQGYY